LGSVPNGAVSGGNSRGIFAVDLQLNRNVATQVASGNYSVILGGSDNISSATASVVTGGSGSTASGDYSIITGGIQGNAGLYGQQVHASGRFSAQGDAQSHELIWRREISGGSSATDLFLDGTSLTADIQPNTVWHGIINITSICSVGGGAVLIGEVSSTSFRVTIKYTGATAALVGTVQQIGTTDNNTNMSTNIFTIQASSNYLQIQYTPPSVSTAAHTFRVVAVFRGLQIQY